MSATKMTKSISIARLLLAPVLALFLAAAAHAAVPGITGPTFNLTAQTAFLNQPDGKFGLLLGIRLQRSAGRPSPRRRSAVQPAPRCRFPDPR